LIIRCPMVQRSYLCTLLAILLFCFSVNAVAVEFVVNVTDDAVDVNPGDGVCETRNDSCSLRAAVQESNVLPGADRITLPAGLFSLVSGSTNEDNAQSGDLDILDDLTIRGAPMGQTRITGANNVSGVFSILSNAVNPSPTVSLEQLSLSEGLDNVDGGIIYTEGALSLTQVSVADAGFNNAAVYAKDTSLTIENSTFLRNNISVSVLRSQLNISTSRFKDNQFTSGAPVLITNSAAQINRNDFINNQGSDGAGAISAINSKAIINFNTFSGNNSASAGSGAISLKNGSYSIKGNSFSGNTSARSGGAIGADASVFIESNTFKGNVSGRSGGAIDVGGFSPVTITNSFFDSNNAAEDCGAIAIQRDSNAKPLVVENSVFRENVAGNVGGAICFDHKVTISHSEFTGNISRTHGGALYSTGNASSIMNTTISGNLAVLGSAIYQKTNAGSKLDLRHVTIADNASTDGNTASIVTLAAMIVVHWVVRGTRQTQARY